MTLRDKIRPGALFGDLQVVGRTDEKLRNGTYKYAMVCVHCGSRQTRGYQNLKGAKHPRCSFCPGSGTSHMKAYPVAIVTIASRGQMLALQGTTITNALDSCNLKLMHEMTREPFVMTVSNSGQPVKPLEGVNMEKLLVTLALRQREADSDALMDESLQYDLPRPPQAIIEAAPEEPSYQPIHEPYELVKKSHFKFFDWEREAPVGEQLPPEIAQLVDRFEKDHGDITEYHFSASPADAGAVYIYWTKHSE